MSVEVFAEYVAEQVANKVKTPEVQNLLQKALVAESITPFVLVNSEQKDLHEAILGHFKAEKAAHLFNLGLKTSLKCIQKTIHNALSADKSQSSDKQYIELRKFDTPAQADSTYQLGYCKPASGNLMIPTHEFRYGKNMNCAFMSREVVRFAAACINGRKNGTIHFGIETSSEGGKFGNILGIPQTADMSEEKINKEIFHCINKCFGQHAELISHCVRPVQAIFVGLDLVVFEVDVVPTQWFCPSQVFAILFPPKGCQEEKIFVLSQGPQCEVMTVSPKQLDDLQNVYQKVFQERIQLENCNVKDNEESPDLKKKLSTLLAGTGNDYVTDEFVPIIISGNISGCENEEQIRKDIDMQFAFTSAKAVLDFDASTQLRKQVENNSLTFHVKTAEDFICPDKNSIAQSPVWLHCNGNNDLSMSSYGMIEWANQRRPGVIKMLEAVRETIPKHRARVIFLIYHLDDNKRKDPLIEIARDAVMSMFTDECIFIASDESALFTLKTEMDQIVDERMIEHRFFGDLNWAGISEVMSTVFHTNPSICCKLPSSYGQTVIMTRKEMENLKLTDIDILSGEQCKPEYENKNKIERQTHREDMEERFYKGGKPADWWNFFYETHVGKRNKFSYHEEEIKKKLKSSKGEALIEFHIIEHHPGAGGSTLARHLLWHFSQFRGDNQPYRCCLVKNITEQTVDQIESFRGFRDEKTKRPFIVLVDNKNEDGVRMLRMKLNEAAYKTGSPGKLFCLILLVKRVPISEKPSGKDNHLLTHQLKGKEVDWFEDKYKELDDKKSIEVETLIAFNVMRQSFNEDYIKNITSEFMEHVTPTELKVLTCLSLINTYDSDHTVPQNVFDKLMQEQTLLNLVTLPFGIVHSMKEKRKLAQFECRGAECFWGVNMSNPMSLLVTKQEDNTLDTSGICIISQPLARAVLQDIIDRQQISLNDVVNEVLKLVEEHCNETNPMSKNFVKIVCSLFKTRQNEETDKSGTKLEFSYLVLDLSTLGAEVVLNLMGKCFELTEDPMVGQQLARYNIHIKNFHEAETTIKKSLRIKSSSYLMHTYGQIFKSQMEHLVDQEKRNITPEWAAEISRLAFKAIQMFKSGQMLSINKETDINMACFLMEVKTALNFLEKFEKFDCYDKKSFLEFLNNPNFQIGKSPYAHLMELCPHLEQLQCGSQWQVELEQSLRYLEETNYQIKSHLYTVYTDEETLLLHIRERFERFYGNKNDTDRFQFRFGLGLKAIMTASKNPDHQCALEERVNQAKSNLANKHLQHADIRDLLVYIGYYISQLSVQTNNCPDDYRSMYQNLLRYSTRLLDLQRNDKTNKRIYMESFLYFAMLHWPLKSRLSLGLDSLAKGTTYDIVVKEWEKTFNENHFIDNEKKSQLKKPKNYFALGIGKPGRDIVDLKSISKEWVNQKEKEGRHRRPVFDDNFWRENFVENRLERLDGIVDGRGHIITHSVSTDDLQSFKPTS